MSTNVTPQSIAQTLQSAANSTRPGARLDITAGETSQAKADKTAQQPKDRTVRDVLTLSDGAQKIINLDRGKELARALPVDAKSPDFKTALKDALDDIKRIMTLFSETMKGLWGKRL